MLTFYRKEPFWLEGSYTYPNHIPYPTTFIGMEDLSLWVIHNLLFDILGRFKINGVKPTPEDESSKVKVKVRINPNGIFTISSASMYEKSTGPTISEVDDPMETEQQSGEPAESAQTQPNGSAPSAEQMETDVSE